MTDINGKEAKTYDIPDYIREEASKLKEKNKTFWKRKDVREIIDPIIKEYFFRMSVKNLGKLLMIALEKELDEDISKHGATRRSVVREASRVFGMPETTTCKGDIEEFVEE